MATRPDWNPQAPAPGTRGYIRVVARGCGLVHYEMEGDWDCRHRYAWPGGCDDCPVSLEARNNEPETKEEVFKLL